MTTNIVSARDIAIAQWAEDIIACGVHRYHFGNGKSFYSAFFESPKIFRYDIICYIIDSTNYIESEEHDDNFDYGIADVRRTVLSFAEERGWRIFRSN
ncbi:MAG: hypothetical protein LBL13_03100 [Bacteroidales bacterium]|nr:hypothetical protein [Bacteroidales bacterium]